MPGLVPGIHILCIARKAWMAGSSPAMTPWKQQRLQYLSHAGPVAIGGPFSWPHSDHEPS